MWAARPGLPFIQVTPRSHSSRLSNTLLAPGAGQHGASYLDVAELGVALGRGKNPPRRPTRPMRRTNEPVKPQMHGGRRERFRSTLARLLQSIE